MIENFKIAKLALQKQRISNCPKQHSVHVKYLKAISVELNANEQ